MTKWHLDQNQKNLIINLVNSEGYILEDKLIVSLTKFRNFNNKINSRDVLFRSCMNGEERIEIDAWTKYINHYLVFEFKSSSYEWIFLRGPRTTQDKHHLYNSAELGLYTRAHSTANDETATENAFEVLLDEKQKLAIQNPKPVLKGLKLPERPSGREIVRSAFKQVLKNTETLANKLTKSSEAIDCSFLPIIVTNTNLFLATYDDNQIDENANLTDFSNIEPKPWLILNQREILHHGQDYKETVQHLGFGDSHNKNRYTGSHLKSVFIVQQQSLHDFLKRFQ